ncbi:hypothetical protein [Caballeronia telluris]|nr:hypothetical protein [Caballeronia telluris]
MRAASLAIVIALANEFACATSPLPQVVFFDTANVADREVRLGDVVNLSVLPAQWQTEAARIVVANLPRCCKANQLPTARLARAARLRMPGITPWMQGNDIASRTIVIEYGTRVAEQQAPAMTRVHASSCMRIEHPVAAGVAIRRDDIDPSTVACGNEAVRRVAYSRDTRVVHAAQALSPGDVVTALPLSTLARVRRGEPTMSSISAGLVTVSRTFIAPRDEAIGRLPLSETPSSSGDQS